MSSGSILAIPNSILAYYGARTQHATLPLLDQALAGRPRNVVLLVLDGLGLAALKYHVPQGFLLQNLAAVLNSVNPSTTTAALATFESGLSPVQHGWLGWSLYFSSIKKCVDLYSGRESASSKMAADSAFVWQKIGYVKLFAKIRQADQAVECCLVSPFARPKTNSLAEVCQRIEELCQKPGRRYIYAYHFQPDKDMHIAGCYSKRVKADLVLFDQLLARLAAQLPDSLLIVTADHGLTDIADLAIEELPDLAQCLALPLSREPRNLSLFIKSAYQDKFQGIWQKYFADDFILLPADQALAEAVFGPGQPHPLARSFLGDYVALARGKKSLWYLNEKGRPSAFKAGHAGLLDEEIKVPLIMLSS